MFGLVLRVVIGVVVFLGMGYVCSFAPLLHRVAFLGLTGSMILSLLVTIFVVTKVKA